MYVQETPQMLYFFFAIKYNRHEKTLTLMLCVMLLDCIYKSNRNRQYA